MNIEYYIEETLMDIISEKSIDKVFVNDIIKRTGVCKKTFYKYYCDKYELLTICFQKNFYSKFTGLKHLNSLLSVYVEEVVKIRKNILNAFCSSDVNSLREYNVKFFSDFIIKNSVKADSVNADLTMLADAYGELITIETLRWLRKGSLGNYKPGAMDNFAAFLAKLLPFALKNVTDEASHDDSPKKNSVRNNITFIGSALNVGM